MKSIKSVWARFCARVGYRTIMQNHATAATFLAYAAKNDSAQRMLLTGQAHGIRLWPAQHEMFCALMEEDFDIPGFGGAYTQDDVHSMLKLVRACHRDSVLRYVRWCLLGMGALTAFLAVCAAQHVRHTTTEGDTYVDQE